VASEILTVSNLPSQQWVSPTGLEGELLALSYSQCPHGLKLVSQAKTMFAPAFSVFKNQIFYNSGAQAASTFLPILVTGPPYPGIISF